jgi:hypothetical protein
MGVDWLDVGPFAVMHLAPGSTGYQIDANLDRFDASRARQPTKPKPEAPSAKSRAQARPQVLGQP